MKDIVAYATMKSKENLVRLNGNESYLPINNEFIMELHSALQGIDLHRYPDSDSTIVKELYAKYIDIKTDNIIVGNGSDEMISLVIGANISKDKKVLTLDPDFSMYDFYTSLNEGILLKYKCNKDGQFNIEKFIEYGIDNKVNLIIFSRPNNPTGKSIKNDEIRDVLKAFPKIPIVVDEAYYEFIEETIVNDINNFSNLYVTRTLSKAWGLAALRIGFLISNDENIKKISKYKQPYNVNLLSQAIAARLLERPDRVKENVRIIKLEREKFYRELSSIEKESSLDIEFYPSEGNYIFGRTPYLEALIKVLSNKDIVIRTFNDDSFRITVGSPYENERVIRAIKSAFVYEGDLIYGEEDIE